MDLDSALIKMSPVNTKGFHHKIVINYPEGDESLTTGSDQPSIAGGGTSLSVRRSPLTSGPCCVCCPAEPAAWGPSPGGDALNEQDQASLPTWRSPALPMLCVYTVMNVVLVN